MRNALEKWSMLGLGSFGVVLFLFGAHVFWEVTHSPGDDNPIGLLGLTVALISLVPAYGVTLHLRHEPLREHLVWLAVASIASVPLLLVLLILWTVW